MWSGRLIGLLPLESFLYYYHFFSWNKTKDLCQPFWIFIYFLSATNRQIDTTTFIQSVGDFSGNFWHTENSDCEGEESRDGEERVWGRGRVSEGERVCEPVTPGCSWSFESRPPQEAVLEPWARRQRGVQSRWVDMRPHAAWCLSVCVCVISLFQAVHSPETHLMPFSGILHTKMLLHESHVWLSCSNYKDDCEPVCCWGVNM